MDVQTLIEDMQVVKAQNPSLELQDILRIFNIKALQELANAMRLSNG